VPVKFVDGTLQTDVAFLHEIEEQHAAPHVLAGNGHDEAQVGLDEPPAGGLATRDILIQAGALRGLHVPLSQPLLRGSRGLQALSQVYLLLGGEEGRLADLAEVERGGAVGR
jgi:hypothetical protein